MWVGPWEKARFLGGGGGGEGRCRISGGQGGQDFLGKARFLMEGRQDFWVK